MPNTREKLYRLGVIDATDPDGGPIELGTPIATITESDFAADARLGREFSTYNIAAKGENVFFKFAVALGGGSYTDRIANLRYNESDGFFITDEVDGQFFANDAAAFVGDTTVAGFETFGEFSLAEISPDGQITTQNQIDDTIPGVTQAAGDGPIIYTRGSGVRSVDFADPQNPQFGPASTRLDPVSRIHLSGDFLYVRSDSVIHRYGVSGASLSYIGPVKPQYVGNYELSFINAVFWNNKVVLHNKQAAQLELFNLSRSSP